MRRFGNRLEVSHFQLQSCKWSADAAVYALSEGELPLRLRIPLNVEVSYSTCFVAIGRAPVQHDTGIRGNADPSDFGCFSRSSVCVVTCSAGSLHRRLHHLRSGFSSD